MANKNAKKALEQFKNEAANEVGVTLNQGYNGNMTSKDAGHIGGNMVNTVFLERRMKIRRRGKGILELCIRAGI